jgi:MFS family permease
VRNRPDLPLVLAVVFFTGTFGLNFQMTSALMATEVYGKGAGEYGLLGSILAVGSLTGSLVAARRTRIRHRLVIGAALTFGTVEIVAAFAPTYLTYALLTPLLGLTALTMITAANSFMQLKTDAGMRGRVMALYLMIFMGGTPVGAPLIGWIGEQYGARATLWVGGAATIGGTLLAAGLFWLSVGPGRAGAGGGPDRVLERAAQAVAEPVHRVLTPLRRPSRLSPRVWDTQAVARARNQPLPAQTRTIPGMKQHHRARQGVGH